MQTHRSILDLPGSRMTRRGLSLASLAFASLLVIIAPASAQGIRDLLATTSTAYGVPAMAAAVVTSDEIIELDAVGMQRLDAPIAVLPSDRFHIGSMTKAMTATLLAILIEEGRLSWETRVADLFPEMGPTVHSDYRDITVRDLVAHRAGLPPFQKFEEFEALPFFAGSSTDRRAAFTRYLLMRSSAEDRGDFLYSNAGYAIAGAVAERVTGIDWKSLMQTRLFEPLGMEASFGWPALVSPDQPWGHWEVNGVLTPHAPDDDYQLSDLIRPAGDVHASLGEYVKFLQLHIRGLQERESLLSPASFRTLHEPIGSYALGWDVGDANGAPVSLHFGSAGTFYSVAALSASLDLGIVVFTNAGHERARQALEAVGNELIRIYAGSAAGEP